MRRRDVLAGAAGIGVLGVGGAIGFGGWDPFGDETAVAPLELDGIEAAGSSSDSVTVPREGTVSLVESFATWCPDCQRMMTELPTLHAEVGDEIQFVSATVEALGDADDRAAVADWWDEHGGMWQVVHDPGLTLLSRLGGSSVPYSAVLDADNRVTYAESGYTGIDELRAEIDAARS